MDLNKESFIPDIIPPEIREEEPIPAPEPPAPKPPEPAKKPELKATSATSAFHVHHAIVGLAIAGASACALAIPSLKPMTKIAVAGLGITIGAVLVYDDILQHQEGNCDIATIFNFTPCAQVQKVTVIRKP